MVTSLNSAVPARDSQEQQVQMVSGRATAAGAIATYSIKIGTLPAGAVMLGINSKVVTAITGSTPTFNVGTTAAGTDIAAGIALTAGTVNTVPATALVMPLAANTDVWVNFTGTATGDAIVIVQYIAAVG